MAEKHSPGLLNLENELTCSICTDVLYQPQTLLDCLHTFCGSCLKEWFASQASRSTDANPATCPQCRATVRETRPDARVTTLLDMFLQVNPGQKKTQAEKDELAKIYKPGDSVLPKVKRRRDNRADQEDRRLVDEVREMSLREVDGGRSSSRTRRHGHETRSRSAEHRTPEDQHRRRREEQGEGRSRRTPGQHTSAPVSRQTTAEVADPRSSTRPLEHQSSLTSLLSSADGGHMAEEILRQIREEGLLDGVNLDDLDIGQQDELSERIADAYRRRHLQRQEQQHGRRSDETNTRSSLSPEEHSSRRHTRARSTDERNGEARHPPVSRPRLLEAANPDSRHRRSTSDQGRRQTSPGPRSSRNSVPVPNPATRSATDLSSRSESRSPRTRPRQLSDTNRRTTEPASQRVTETWSQIKRHDVLRQSEGRDVSGPRLTDSPTTDTFGHPSRSTTPGTPRQREARIAPSTSTSPRQTEPRPRQGDIQQERLPRPRARSNISITTRMSNQSAMPATVTPLQPSLYPEPSISCDRCEKENIQYDTHKSCSRCNDGNYNLCLQCFRAGRGCLHWFGFGHKAMTNYLSKHPTERGSSRPHVLSGHKYLPPPASSLQPPSPNSKIRLTSDDPSKRLQSGMFCDICSSLTDSCYWKCDTCNEGEWGFCNNCVNKGSCCTHPLLPLSHESTELPFPPGASILDTPTTPDFGDYSPLTFSTTCNLCSYPISPSTTRFHCPNCLDSDYNIHEACYLKLMTIGKISKENGPTGWRRCPLNGHRMIVIGYEDQPEGQKRVLVRDLVGGHGLEDSKMSPTGVTPHWRWQGADGQRRTRLISRDVSSSTTGSEVGSTISSAGRSFPPDGGDGMVAVGRWSYFPETAGAKDLCFPKWAEIKEVEDINGDWFGGVYAGRKGVFPSSFVMVVPR